MRTGIRATVLLALVFALLAALGGVAQGQDDGPMLAASGDDVTVEEGEEETTYSVEEAGTYDITVEGSGFTIDVFVLQCPGAAGSLEAIQEGDATALCDLGNLLPASPDADGNFEVTFEGVEIDGCGLVFAAGDAAQTEGAFMLVSVANPGDDVECEVVEAEGYDESLAGTGAEGEEGAGGDLADTGLNSTEVLLIALVTLVAGAIITTEARRMSRARA